MIIKKYPLRGDRRIIKKFAWFPKLVGNLSGGSLIWLEYYYSHQVYKSEYWEQITWHEVKVRRIEN